MLNHTQIAALRGALTKVVKSVKKITNKISHD